MIVRRVITYEGPEDRVRETLKASLAEGKHAFRPDLVVTIETEGGPREEGIRLSRRGYRP